MSDDGNRPTRFIRVNGRVIPIRAVQGAARTVKAVRSANVIRKGVQAHRSKVAHDPAYRGPDKAWGAAALGLGAAAGAVGAASFFTKGKLGWAGLVAGEALGIAGTAAAGKAVIGKGHTKERVRDGAKLEAGVEALDWGVFAAGMVGTASRRTALFDMAKSGASSVAGAAQKFGGSLAWAGGKLRKVAF